MPLTVCVAWLSIVANQVDVEVEESSVVKLLQLVWHLIKMPLLSRLYPIPLLSLSAGEYVHMSNHREFDCSRVRQLEVSNKKQ